MNKYPIVVVLWEDHIEVQRSELPKNVDDLFSRPTLSVGILFKETEKSLLIISDIERYPDRNDASYTAILKSAVIGIKKYGFIKLKDIE